jgi:predicted alpha/beta superfamily hydrolase
MAKNNKFLLLLILCVFFIGQGVIAATSPKRVDIFVSVPRFTPSQDPIYITGNTEELCRWKPDCRKLTPSTQSVFHTTLNVTPGEQLKLKFNRGDWKSQAADETGKAWEDFIIDVRDPSDPIVISVVNWSDLGPLRPVGQIDSYTHFFSPQLKNDRTIHVWTPDSYREESAEQYQVIYMHDGQNVFHAETSTFGVPWGIDGTITSLMEEKAIGRTIVVAIDCTEDRTEEYDFFRNGATYARFVIETVKPFIDSHYRTLKDRDHTFVMGSSMGALISLEMLWVHSDVFSAAAGLSLPAFYENEKFVSFFQSHPVPKAPVKIYFDHGDYGDDKIYEPSVKRFHQQLLSVGVHPSQIFYQVFPFAEHNEAAWARRLDIPLKFILNK